MNLLESIRKMTGYAEDSDGFVGACQMFSSEGLWVLVGRTGGAMNAYGDITGATETTLPLKGHVVPITKRLMENIGGDWSDVSMVLRVDSPAAAEGAMVRHEPDDGIMYKVVRVVEPTMGDAAVCYNLLLKRQKG